MIKKPKYIFLIFILCIIVFNSNYIAYGEKETALPSGLVQSELKSTIDTYVKEHEDTTAGVSISIFNGEDTLFRGDYGYADIENEIPINKETVFEWGSTTKLLVWVSVLQLWEQDKIDFNEDIRNYLPENFITKSNPSERITMLNLMHHDAGWQDVLTDLFVKDFKKTQGLGKMLQKTEPEQIYSVGEMKAYSNWGTALAAYIVEERTGKKFYEYVNENIFRPLDMEYTAILPDLSDNLWVKERRQEIQGYTNDKKLIKNNFFHITLYPVGMATGTIEDFEKFGKSLLNDTENQKLFKNKDTLNYLLKPTIYYGDTNYPYNANGLWVMEWDVRTLGHGGNTEGFSSNLLIDPISKTGVVVMTNQKYEEVYNYDLMPLIFGEFNPKVTNKPLSKVEEISGIYQNGRTILKGHGKLYSLMGRLKMEEAGENKLKVSWAQDSYIAYEFAPNLYNLDGSILHIKKDDKGSTILSMAYGDYYKISQCQIFKEYIFIVAGIIAIFYSLIILIIKLLTLIFSKKSKRFNIRNPIEKYNSFISLIPLIFILNLVIMYLKMINYSPSESIVPHIYLYFVIMIIPFIYIIALPFMLKKWDINRITKIKYIFTGIAGIIISLNIYFWQLFII